MKSVYKSNRNVVYSCKYHVVWCPKYRRKILTGSICLRLKEILPVICDSIGVDLLSFEIMPDHLHLLIDVDPQYGVNNAVKFLKGKTAFLLRKEFPDSLKRMPSLWSNSYFVSSVGGASLEVVKKYIEGQNK